MQKPFVQNAADESQVKSSRQKEKLLVDSESNDLRFILATEQGRRFVWAMLSECGIYETSADNSGSWTYFKEGKRDIGLKLLAKIMSADPTGKSYIQMMTESKKERI